MSDIEVRIGKFVRLCQGWDAVSLAKPAGEANAISDRIWGIGERLRADAVGREALEQLAVASEFAAVRLKAAVTCLRWAPDVGVASLEQILAGQGDRYGMLPSLAFVLLAAYREGTLFAD